MKNLRQLCASAVLTLALAAYTAAGTIHTGVAESEPGAAPVTEIALDLLQRVLSLF
jgi:hypothetical protein